LLASPKLLWFGDRRGESLNVHSVGEAAVKKLLVLVLGEEGVPFGEHNSSADMILDQATEWGAIGGHEVLVVGVGNEIGLSTGDLVLGEMHVHLITIKISIVGVAIGVVHTQRLLAGENTRNVSHHGRLVECGLAVHDHNVAILDVTKDLLADYGTVSCGLGGEELVAQRSSSLEREIGLFRENDT